MSNSFNYRAWQQAQTELNADGNDGRGRQGEDLLWESSNPLERPFQPAPLHYNYRKITDEEWVDILKALHFNGEADK